MENKPETDAPAEDLWFLPGPVDEAPSAPPGLRDWQQAEGQLAGSLARAAAAFGALDERLRHVPAGLRHRLALREVSAMTWHLGARLPEDRLGLYLAARLSGAQDSARDLARAGWAHRRLMARQRLDPGDLAGFLGRVPHADGGDFALSRPQGTEFGALAGHWAAGVRAAAGLHPFSRAALAWHSWRGLELSGAEGLEEGATAAALIGAEAVRNPMAGPVTGPVTGSATGIGFAPLALAGQAAGRAYRAGGGAESRLSAWLAAAEQAALAGLMACDRLATWCARADAAIAPLSGRVPRLLVAALPAWPMASVPMLTTQTGASGAAVQRNLARLKALGLVREVTGQTRYRFWAVAD